MKLSSSEEQYIINAINKSTVTTSQVLTVRAEDVAKASATNPVLNNIIRMVQSGWSCDVSDKLQPYFSIRDELSEKEGCLLWHSCVVIPTSLRQRLLVDLHSSHFGACKMNSVGRSFFWWPKMDEDIRNVTAKCHACQEYARNPRKEDIHHWAYPS